MHGFHVVLVDVGNVLCIISVVRNNSATQIITLCITSASGAACRRISECAVADPEGLFKL